MDNTSGLSIILNIGVSIATCNRLFNIFKLSYEAYNSEGIPSRL